MQKKLIVIGGPTATGKTALGVELALRLGGEVVSADSMQVYRGMDIGTAKATPAEMRGVPHHLLDIAEPEESFSVSLWVEKAGAAVEDIFARGAVPIIVGGTGLYITSLLAGRSFAASGADTALRAGLGREYDEAGGEAFREKLSAVDPERAAVLHPADKKRLVRAMEVYLLTGRTISQHDRETRLLPPRWPSARFALSYADRELLYARIDRRVDDMIDRGLFAEAAELLDRGVPDSATAMQAIGYKEAAMYLRGEISRDEAAELIKLASRRYAKRQLTWLRRDPELHWILRDSVPDTAAAAEIVTAEFNK